VDTPHVDAAAAQDRSGEDTFLAEYDPRAFPPFALTVDLNVFTIRDGVLCALLVERAEHPYRGSWALPGGHVGHGVEDADTAATRELQEETGLDWSAVGGHLEQLRTYSDPARDPRIRAGLHVASVAYVALAPTLPDPQPGSDVAKARFWPLEDLDLDAQCAAWVEGRAYAADAPPVAYDHALILSDALERVRAKLEYTTLALQFVTEPFSLADLRRVYGAVWGYLPDLPNFRRKMLGTEDLLRAVRTSDRPATDAGGRPPLLFERGPAQWLTPPLMRSAEEGS